MLYGILSVLLPHSLLYKLISDDDDLWRALSDSVLYRLLSEDEIKIISADDDLWRALSGRVGTVLRADTPTKDGYKRWTPTSFYLARSPGIAGIVEMPDGTRRVAWSLNHRNDLYYEAMRILNA